MWLFPAFVAVPLIEIALFVVIGGAIGVWMTLLWVVAGAVVGMAVLRTTSAHAARGVSAAMDGLQDPTGPLADGAIRAVGAILLILPGFLTDAIGLALLLPVVRGMILRRMMRRPARRGRQDAQRDIVIDAEYRDVTPVDRDSRLP